MIRPNSRIVQSIILAAALSSALALARGREGNGGNVVVCFDTKESADSVRAVLEQNAQSTDEKNVRDPFSNEILGHVASVRLFDLHESAQGLFDNPETFIEDNRNFKEILNDRIKLIEDKSFGFAQDLHDTFTNKLPNSNWLASGNGVVDIQDTMNVVSFDEKCALVQAAVQLQPIDKAPFEVHYDSRLFSLLPPVHQAALVLHEWIYNIAIARGHTDSRATRDAVRLIFSRGFTDLAPAVFTNRIYRLKLNDSTATFLTFGNLSAQTTNNILLNSVQLWGLEFRRGEYFEQIGNAAFDDILGAYGEYKWLPAAKRQITIMNETLTTSGADPIIIHKGAIYKFTDKSFATAGNQPLRLQGLDLKGEITVHPNGRIAQATLAAAAQIQGVAMPAGAHIVWDINGQALLAKVDFYPFRQTLKPEDLIRTSTGMACTMAEFYDKTGKISSCTEYYSLLSDQVPAVVVSPFTVNFQILDSDIGDGFALSFISLDNLGRMASIGEVEGMSGQGNLTGEPFELNGVLCSSAKFDYSHGSNSWSCVLRGWQNIHGVDCAGGATVTFYGPNKDSLASCSRITDDPKNTFDGLRPQSASAIEFYPNGKVKQFTVGKRSFAQKLAGKCAETQKAVFSEDGKLQGCSK
jgi:hypothetical protein